MCVGVGNKVLMRFHFLERPTLYIRCINLYHFPDKIQIVQRDCKERLRIKITIYVQSQSSFIKGWQRLS